ncbi:MAG: hypothetical protein VX589_10485 [Myxococcota bacterium]|nr:hypothetical protein [Myxococcota bacterium]
MTLRAIEHPLERVGDSNAGRSATLPGSNRLASPTDRQVSSGPRGLDASHFQQWRARCRLDMCGEQCKVQWIIDLIITPETQRLIDTPSSSSSPWIHRLYRIYEVTVCGIGPPRDSLGRLRDPRLHAGVVRSTPMPRSHRHLVR